MPVKRFSRKRVNKSIRSKKRVNKSVRSKRRTRNSKRIVKKSLRGGTKKAKNTKNTKRKKINTDEECLNYDKCIHDIEKSLNLKKDELKTIISKSLKKHKNDDYFPNGINIEDKRYSFVLKEKIREDFLKRQMVLLKRDTSSYNTRASSTYNIIISNHFEKYLEENIQNIIGQVKYNLELSGLFSSKPQDLPTSGFTQTTNNPYEMLPNNQNSQYNQNSQNSQNPLYRPVYGPLPGSQLTGENSRQLGETFLELNPITGDLSSTTSV